MLQAPRYIVFYFHPGAEATSSTDSEHSSLPVVDEVYHNLLDLLPPPS